MCGFFKRNCLGLQHFLTPTNSCWFLQPAVVENYLPGTGTLGWWPGVGLGLFTPDISLLNIYLPHMGEGPAHSMSASFLPVWMDVVSSIL